VSKLSAKVFFFKVNYSFYIDLSKAFDCSFAKAQM